MKLHLCVICGRDNRYHYLRHTVRHALPVFDTIHIMDTGSTDGTSLLGSSSSKINYFHWDRWDRGWGDAYDHVRRDVPGGEWFLYLDSDELPSQYLLDHIRDAVARIENEGYGQARIPNVLHVDGRRQGDPASKLPCTPEELRHRECWTKPIICRNDPELCTQNFGMHAVFRHQGRPITFLPLYYCHHKYTAQIDASLSICSFLLPESYDIPAEREENRALRELAERFDIVDPNRLVWLLQHEPPAAFIDLIAGWKDNDLATCRHWYAWYRRGFAVGGHSLSLCEETCCRYRDAPPLAPAIVGPRSVPELRDDWRLEPDGEAYVLRSSNNHSILSVNDSAASVAAMVDGRDNVASIVHRLAEAFPEAGTEVRDGTLAVIQELASSGALELRDPPSFVSDDARRAIMDAVRTETAFWRRRGPWNTEHLRDSAAKSGLIFASMRDGMVRLDWNGHEESRCRIVGPYLQGVAMANHDIHVDIAISPSDGTYGNEAFPVLGFSKRPGDVQAVMIPDIYFLNGYGELRRTIKEAADHVRWDDKLERAVWRGAPTGLTNNEQNWRDNLRLRLCSYSVARPAIIDARVTSFVQCTDRVADLIRRASLDGEWLPERKQMLYKYVLNLDGNSASWSGSFWKLLSNSLMIQVLADEQDSSFDDPSEKGRSAAPPGYAGHRQWYHPWLQRDRHFLACRLEDLESTITWARRHDSECREISSRSTEFAEEYLTDAAGYAYLVEILKALTRIQFGGQ